jgi:hypothetical protein
MQTGKRTWRSAAAASVVAGLVAFGCGDDARPTAPTPPPVAAVPPQNPPPSPPVEPDAVLVGAGDIAMCGSPGVEATAALLDNIPGTVFTAGDNAYPNGSLSDFGACYESTWGRQKHRTRPAPGNHEYYTPGATDYYQYYGSNAGPAGRGYYSYREGAWLVVSLNSNVASGSGSPQAEWLKATLAENATPCTLAYWHHPLFTSGPNGLNPYMRELWRILHEAGAEIVIAAHDHLYERFAPQDADGRYDASRGIRGFTVGTGGAHIYDVRSLQPNSEVIGREFGVMKFRLKANSYDWQFIPVAGGRFSDAGSGECH